MSELAGRAGLGMLLAEIDPQWLDGLSPALLAAGRESRLGRAVMLRCLAGAPASALLAPSPEPALDRITTAWPRARLEPFLRNLGILAFAPAIRAEIGREPVRRLKQALGKRYLLALDRKMWDGQVQPGVQTRLQARLSEAVAASDPTATVLAMCARQGRAELRHWASTHDVALAQWVQLLHAGDPGPHAHLPAGAVARLHAHHAVPSAGDDR